jgi:hypothetical protein
VHAPSPAYDAGTQLGRPKRARSHSRERRALRTDAEAPIRTCRWCSHRDARQATVKDAASRLRSKTPTTPRMVNERHSRKDDHIAQYQHAWRKFLALPTPAPRIEATSSEGGETSVHSRVFTLLGRGGASPSPSHSEGRRQSPCGEATEHNRRPHKRMEAPPHTDAAAARAPRPRPRSKETGGHGTHARRQESAHKIEGCP